MNQLSLRVLVACALTMSATHIAHATAPSTDGAQKKRPPITKKQRELQNFNDYDKIRDRVYTPKAFTNHDDSVASRKNGQAPVSGGSKPNTTLNPINCKHPAYKSLCDDIKKIIGSGSTAPTPSVPKWYTIYNSSGTRSLNPRDGYANFKLWYKYQASAHGNPHFNLWSNKTGYLAGVLGKNVTIAASATASSSSNCGGERDTATAVATAYLSFNVGNVVNVPASATATKDQRMGCAWSRSTATIRNVYITRMDIFY